MEHSEVEECSTLEEQLDQLCVYYMSMGVPYEEFWYGDYCKLKYYEEVYLRKRKIRNEEMWMMGAYNYNAHAVVLSNAFRGKGQKAQDYLKEPIPFFPKTEQELEVERRKERQRIYVALNAWKTAWEKKHGISRHSESTDTDSGQLTESSGQDT